MNSIVYLYLLVLILTTFSIVRTQYYPYNYYYYAQGSNNQDVYSGANNGWPQQNGFNQQQNSNGWPSSSSSSSSSSYVDPYNGGQISQVSSFSSSNAGPERPIRAPQGNHHNNNGNKMHQGGKKKNSNKKKKHHPRRPNKQRYKDFKAVYHDIQQKADPDTFNATLEESDNNDDFNGRSIVAPGQYPHMAALGFRSPHSRDVEFKCGGSLISEFFVLTAAHCCYLNGQEPKVIKIGDIKLKERERDLQPQRRGVAQIYIHPLYNSSLHYHDIALIQLNRPIEYTHFVRPIRLWAQDEITYEKVFTMGYGSTSFAQSPTNILTELDLSIVPLDVCNATMPAEDAAPEGITEGQLCAKDFILNRDTCQGDSGGPLQLNLERRWQRPDRNKYRYYLVGITSYGAICRSEYPGIYTKVSWYIDWIAPIVWPNYFEGDGY